MTKSRTTTIAIAAGIVVLGIVAYFLWLRPSNDELVSVSGYGPASEVQATFLNLAAQLEPVAFDPRILSDERFLSLIDIHTSIVPETSGRTDPFAPLPGIAAD